MSVSMSNAKKKEILFVFEGQKGKTRRARELETAAIRSHAARNARRKKQKDTRDSGSVVQIETISLDPPSPILPIQKPVKLPSIPVLLAWRPADSRVAPEEEGQIDGSLETEEETPSPVSILGQGRVDPFGTCFSTSLPVHILKYLDYGTLVDLLRMSTKALTGLTCTSLRDSMAIDLPSIT